METLNETINSSNMKLAGKINTSNEIQAENRFSSSYSRQSHYEKLREKKRSRKHRHSYIIDKSKSRAHRKHRSKKPKGYYDIPSKNISDSKFRGSSFNSIFNKSHRNHKSKQLPILASIELIKEKCNEQLVNAGNGEKKINGSSASSTEKVLFKDYVLIPSSTKFKHLLFTVLDHVRFPNKNDYSVADGYLKIENWKPIRLDNISSIAQCPPVQSSSSSVTSLISISNLKKETDSGSTISTKCDVESESNAQQKTNNSDNLNYVNNQNTNNSTTNNNNENTHSIRANDVSSVLHLSLPTSLNTSSSRISLSSSSNESSRHSSSSRRSSNYHTRRRSLSSSSTQNSDYSDYENDYDSENENEDISDIKSADTMTVNDMLFHVISFATLTIKLTVKSNPDLNTKTLHKSQSLSKIEDLAVPAAAQPTQSKVQLNPQQSFLQNYLMSLQSKQSQENSSQQKNPTVPITTQLLQNSGLFNQNNSKSSDDIQKKFNEILLPMIMMSNSASVAASMSNSMPSSPASSSSNTPLSNFNNHSNSTNTANGTNASPLTSSQLATLLPILNLPILSQLLNGIKNNSGDTASQQQQLKSLFHEPLNLSSTSNNPLNRLIKSENTNSLNFENSHVNQPLNLCKENPQVGSGRKLSNFNTTAKSPQPMTNTTQSDRNNFLLVNVNGSSHPNNNQGNAQNNSSSVITSIFNTSPSPSISSSSSSSAPSSEKSLNPSLQSTPQLNHHKHFSNMSNTKNSYIVNNRRQRERTTFDPQEEITRLMQIFERTHHPTRYQIASICDSLNSLACRRDKKPLEPYNIQYWFKNARAALRRKVKGDPEVNNKSISSGLGNSSLKTDFDKILNGNANNMSQNSLHLSSSNNENYQDSKYSNYDDDENDLDDEEYDDDFDHDQENGYTIDESKLGQVNSDTDINNNSFNQNDEMKLLINENCKHEKNTSEAEIHENGGQLNEHSLPYENYNDENTGDDADDNHYVNSNYSNVNINNENDNDCNESFDEDGFKHNANSTMNSASMTNLLAGHYKNKNLMVNNNSAASLNNSICNNRRNRVFIDPISEVPILEHYFSIETYPDHYLIEKICENLNKGEYRFKFPKLESRNIQLWFKNHRAKLKRLKSTPSSNNNSLANITSSDDIGQNQSINSNGEEKVFIMPNSNNLAQAQSLNSSIDEKNSFNAPNLLNVPVNNQENF